MHRYHVIEAANFLELILSETKLQRDWLGLVHQRFQLKFQDKNNATCDLVFADYAGGENQTDDTTCKLPIACKTDNTTDNTISDTLSNYKKCYVY